MLLWSLKWSQCFFPVCYAYSYSMAMVNKLSYLIFMMHPNDVGIFYANLIWKTECGNADCILCAFQWLLNKWKIFLSRSNVIFRIKTYVLITSQKKKHAACIQGSSSINKFRCYSPTPPITIPWASYSAASSWAKVINGDDSFYYMLAVFA